MAHDLIEITGVLVFPDDARLTLCLVKRLETPGWDALEDYTWKRLFEAAPSCGGRFITPYAIHHNGRPDDLGIRGKCWVTLDFRGRGAKKRRARVVALADELRSQEVMLTVRPKRYSYPVGERHRSGTILQFVTLERLGANPRR